MNTDPLGKDWETYLRKALFIQYLTTKLTKQRFQWLHMTNNTDFTKPVQKSHKTNHHQQHLQQRARTTNPDGEEGEESDFWTCHIVFLNPQILAKI